MAWSAHRCCTTTASTQLCSLTKLIYRLGLISLTKMLQYFSSIVYHCLSWALGLMPIPADIAQEVQVVSRTLPEQVASSSLGTSQIYLPQIKNCLNNPLQKNSQWIRTFFRVPGAFGVLYLFPALPDWYSNQLSLHDSLLLVFSLEKC